MKNKGFTVLETIVAIMVASLAIAGATMAARGGIRAGSIAKEEVRAFYLAQEVLEAVNNKRDSNELYNLLVDPDVSWDKGTFDTPTGVCSIGNKCYVDLWDVAGITFKSCGGNCPVLKQEVVSSRYGYGSGATWRDSIYTREVVMENHTSNELVISINIKWNHAGTPMEFRTKTLVTNWFSSGLGE